MTLSSFEIFEFIHDYGECEWLDFKEAWYRKEKKADLIHDLLCLANADVPHERYLFVGVADNGEVTGIEHSLPDNEFRSDIREAQLNRMVPCKYYEVDVHPAKRVGVVEVQASSNAPFVLSRDYSRSGKTVRAGVVYTREGANNTPIDRCAHEAQVERMWRRRFGLETSPQERAKSLVRETHKWISSDDPTSDMQIHYHHDFPEFTVARMSEGRDEFWEPWVERISSPFQKAQASRTSIYHYYIKYHNTVLSSGLLMYPRHTSMPLPNANSAEEWSKEDPQEMEFTLDLNSEAFFVAAMSARDVYDYQGEGDDRVEVCQESIHRDVNVMFGNDVFTILDLDIDGVW